MSTVRLICRISTLPSAVLRATSRADAAAQGCDQVRSYVAKGEGGPTAGRLMFRLVRYGWVGGSRGNGEGVRRPLQIRVRMLIVRGATQRGTAETRRSELRGHGAVHPWLQPSPRSTCAHVRMPLIRKQAGDSRTRGVCVGARGTSNLQLSRLSVRLRGDTRMRVRGTTSPWRFNGEGLVVYFGARSPAHNGLRPGRRFHRPYFSSQNLTG